MRTHSILTLALACMAITHSAAAQAPEASPPAVGDAPPAATEDTPAPAVDDAPAPTAAQPLEPTTTAQATAPAQPQDTGSEPLFRRLGRKRPLPFYLQLGPTAGVLREDAGNRLTARDSRRLYAGGLLLRGGAVVRAHHLVGMRLSVWGRASRAILVDGETSGEWGGIGQATFGPEYRYLTDGGFYFGGSLGLHAVGAGTELQDSPPDPQCDGEACRDVDGRGAVGGALVATVGYQMRVTPWFAMTMELYGSVQAAVDDDDRDMDTASLGVAFGAGL